MSLESTRCRSTLFDARGDKEDRETDGTGHGGEIVCSLMDGSGDPKLEGSE
jgi:hypothetical protein